MDYEVVWNGDAHAPDRGSLLVPAHPTKAAPSLRFAMVNPPKFRGDEKWHGSINGYRYYRCRCAGCVEANAKYFRAYRRRKAA